MTLVKTEHQPLRGDQIAIDDLRSGDSFIIVAPDGDAVVGQAVSHASRASRVSGFGLTYRPLRGEVTTAQFSDEPGLVIRLAADVLSFGEDA